MGRIAGNKVTDSDDVKFWRLVRKTETCWLWIGGQYATGYGRFAPRRYKAQRAHRYAWKLKRGRIPKGKDVCHRCDVRTCIRLSHLFLGTRAENMRDAVEKGRTNRNERHWNAKLTMAKAQEIRSLHQQGLSCRSIAAQMHVSASTISRVCSGVDRGGWHAPT